MAAAGAIPVTSGSPIDVRAEILQAAQDVAKAQRQAVAEWLRTVPPQFPQPPISRARYIDSIPQRFQNHEPDPSVFNKNDKRWINEFLETEGDRSPFTGNAESRTSYDLMEWYHPNLIGHREIAQALIQNIGVPKTSEEAIKQSGATPDADPDAEARNPISAWIQGSYAHPIGKPLRIDARGSHSARGRIVTYEWDLDGDKKYDRTTTDPILTYTWTKEFVGKITLRVTNETGDRATTTTDAMITNDGDSTPYAKDNCPEVYNYSQTDYDKDGIGDACDPTPGYPREDQPGVGEGQPPPPTPSPRPTPTPTPDPLPSGSPSVGPSPSPSPSVTPTAKPSRTPSVTPSPSVSPSSTPSVTPPPTVSPSPSPTEPSSPTATAAPTVTAPPTLSPGPTVSPVPTGSPTGVPPVLPSPTSAPVPTTPQPTTPVPSGTPEPKLPVRPDPSNRPRPGLPNTGT